MKTQAVRIVTACLLMTVGARTQSERENPRPTTIKQAFKTLIEGLAAEPKRDKRCSLLLSFITEHRTRTPKAREVLEARCRLGTLLLTSFDATAARKQFDAVFRHAGPKALDFRGRALYGIAQTHELDSELASAQRVLRQVVEEFRGTRYARYAEIALRRLANSASTAIGSPAPRFGPRLDLAGKPHKRDDLIGKPSCVVFCSAEEQRGLADLQTMLAAMKRGGLDDAQIVLFATADATTDLSNIAQREGWRMPVLACEREFLDPALLRYGVRELPAVFLLGPDGTLLARDPTARRLREALTVLTK